MTPDLFRPGRPCPEPGCPGHLDGQLGYDICCEHCFWLPEDGHSLFGDEMTKWLRRCETESVEPRRATTAPAFPSWQCAWFAAEWERQRRRPDRFH